MTDAISRHLGTSVPQTKQAHPLQVPNAGGGYSFQVSDETKLDRFLILGTEKGTYYTSEYDITKQNIDASRRLMKTKTEWTLDKVVEISDAGRAYRNDPAVFLMALALCEASPQAKFYARSLFTKVVRTSPHLFLWAKYTRLLSNGRGFGTSRVRAVQSWYKNKKTEQLAFQAIKYRGGRYDWILRDLMRMSHPSGVDSLVGDFILGKISGERLDIDKLTTSGAKIIDGFLQAQAASNITELLRVLEIYQELTWETVPTKFHKEPALWKTLFYNGSLTGQALVRNITRIARIGGFTDMVFARDYANKLTDAKMVAKTRLHPIAYLNALIVHQDGQIQRPKGNVGYRSSYSSYANYPVDRRKDWVTSSIIVDALNDGFQVAFANVEPSNKRLLIGLDVSSSMEWAALGLDLSCAQVGAALCTAIAAKEPHYQVMGFSHEFRDLGISRSSSLSEVTRKARQMNFGSTDCSLPMTWASKNNIGVDTFVVITDSETNTGRIHPYKALEDYRQKTGIPARLVVAAVGANDFSIANPEDSGMLDIVGADANMPRLISEFAAGRV